ncbi:hypothetical protein Hanom_Chr05g00422881 [Helianthus anomalus]
MRFRRAEEKVLKEPVVSFVGEQWYKTLITLPTPIHQLDKAALVVAGMSMLWAWKNPTHAPSYVCKGKCKLRNLQLLFIYLLVF